MSQVNSKNLIIVTLVTICLVVYGEATCSAGSGVATGKYFKRIVHCFHNSNKCDTCNSTSYARMPLLVTVELWTVVVSIYITFLLHSITSQFYAIILAMTPAQESQFEQQIAQEQQDLQNELQKEQDEMAEEEKQWQFWMPSDELFNNI